MMTGFDTNRDCVILARAACLAKRLNAGHTSLVEEFSVLLAEVRVHELVRDQLVADAVHSMETAEGAMLAGLTECNRLRALVSELSGEIERLRVIATREAPFVAAIEVAPRENGTPLLVICAPDRETEDRLAALAFATMSCAGASIEPSAPITRIGNAA
jgi:hypothetical protein